MIGLLRETLSTLRRGWHVFLLNLFGLPIVGVSFGLWLWIPEAHWWQLAGTVLLALLIASMAGWLVSTTMRFFHAPNLGLRAALRPSAAAVLLTLIWLAVFLVVFLWLLGFESFIEKLAGYVTAKLPLGVRQTLHYGRVHAAITAGFAALAWYVWPTLWLPVGINRATHGFRRGFRHHAVVLRSGSYWLAMVLPALVASIVPFKLIAWRFGESLSWEIFSLVLRLSLAWFLLLLAFGFGLALAAAAIRRANGRAEDRGGNAVT